MDTHNWKKLVYKYLLGLTSSDEDNKLMASKQVDGMLNEQFNNYDDIKNEKDKPDLDVMLSNIHHKIENSNQTKVRKLNRRIDNFALLRIAAVFLVPLISGILLYYVAFSTEMIEKTNPRGLRSEIVLPDGSKVWLNAESSLKYPENFNSATRQVELSGEAFFEVTHNASKPFKVIAQEVEVTVLGTSFNVKAYQNDKEITTTLVTGKIDINKQLILNPNEEAVYSKTQKKFSIQKNVNTKVHASWKDGIMQFENEKLEDIAKVLERWYDKKIIINNELLNKHKLTITIKDEKIEDVANFISIATSTSFKIDNNIIVFSKNDKQ